MSDFSKYKDSKSLSKNKNILISKNRKAYYEYEIFDKIEAGIELTGTEVRSLRDNNCQLTDCFVFLRKGEAWINNLHIAPFKNGNINNVDPDRKRRLLLHKKEIRYLSQATREKGMTVIPLKIYFKRGHLVKLEIAVARGKKLHDKRASIAKKTQERESQAYLKQRSLKY